MSSHNTKNSNEGVNMRRVIETPNPNDRLLERILSRENMQYAWKRVKANKGVPGVDNISTDEFPDFARENWNAIRESLSDGSYQPLPVKRVEIPKQTGGTRPLGIPTVTDRLIQQAVSQVLTPIFDPEFSEFSYGFRPGRSAHDAVYKVREYIKEGFRIAVDMDLSKFFDTVNHDVLMHRVARKIKDKRVLKLIGKYLRAGVVVNGRRQATRKGVPQGGPLSPLLANILLDDLDKELEKRGHRFVRYADDFVIYLKSKKAAERVMKSITNFITGKLKLKVNEEKSAVSHPWLRKFLGFTFISMCGQTKIRIHQKTIKRFKERVRELTDRNCGISMAQIIYKLNLYLKGWWNYYRLTETRYIFKSLNGWIIRRLRCLLWKQWKNPRTKIRNLLKRGISHRHAVLCGNARKKHWRMSRVKWVIIALPNEYFLDLGLFLPGS